ncbi:MULTISPECIES: TorD/DmsD family molecular chaperone [unclassified Archaeoglobus]|jgi:nitrate reductase assembly molybdenum cofactor insertion protein NarJ|uniref:TorD/DmsD family molecular chaperone n=1 Tax=unclassified Archaeoglobus TaxID=2643606 RepID=UPI0025BC4919|nr:MULTISPECIES: molecular chaperone TorD family protein [unclassified Archaeoglobus]
MKEKILKLFSIIFSYPDEEKLKTAISLAEELGFSEIAEKLKVVDMVELQSEYTLLFISAHPSIPCPPYQSYFEEGKVYGRASVRIKDLYLKFGLDYVYEAEPADHISVELEFLSFYPEHLDEFRDWFLKFADCVERNSSIYSIFARAFRIFLTDAGR